MRNLSYSFDGNETTFIEFIYFIKIETTGDQCQQLALIPEVSFFEAAFYSCANHKRSPSKAVSLSHMTS